jgi:hypothetical protein
MKQCLQRFTYVVVSVMPVVAAADAMPEMATISYWQPADYAKLPSGGIGLINLNDGMLGATPDQIAQYQDVIGQGVARGVRFFAYVPTGYGERDPAEPNEGGTMGQSMDMIHAQVDAYAAAFPGQLMGIFFDETSQSCASAATEYPDLSTYVRGKGMQVAVWNPGWVGDDYCYIKAAPPGDIVVTFEADLTTYATDEFVPKDLAEGHKIARDRGVKTWNLVHTARGEAGLKQALDLIRDRAPDYAYVTDKQDWTIEDTWGAPPSYWAAELQCLQDGACP